MPKKVDGAFKRFCVSSKLSKDIFVLNPSPIKGEAMTLYPKHLSPEQNFIRQMLKRTLSSSQSLGEFSQWLLTGTAVIVGAILINVEGVSQVVSAGSLKWG